ncbi:hypothetical protein [Jeotgalibacillus haloalkalitolerans]|uniref:Uncharacterized protein n=1 Tax=Jeotgalibacillus haloalkalitolerans TaxID=3104292 RepID=A0ABU5KHT9_9BACL|nr:hypothetical protein [Jeotgalibacillus sp. HH7-29]MDZ5710796.1 hypothetical protein [Jeotgalibacillus sp. HH7-29]
MKKLMTTLFSLVLLLSLATPAFATGDTSNSEALEVVDQKNDEIYSEIDHGVAATEALKDNYFSEISQLEEVAHVLALKQEKTAILVALEASGQEDGALNAVLSEKEAQLAQAHAGLDTASEQVQTYFEITAAYEAERDAIIQYVYDVTLALTDQGIQEAAELGLLAKCSWVHVRFGDTREWIDPIEIVGGRR